jgi:uncharacterized membrane protein YeaQ/YmgE (transglycosylase-associated protein family)
MGIILWIVFGALVGWVASLLMGTSGGLISDIVIGIVGSVVGGYAMSLIGKSGVGSFNLYSFLVALLGACVLLIIAKAVRG